MQTYYSRGLTLVHLIRRAKGISPQAFQKNWLGLDMSVVASLPGLARYGQNHALLSGYKKGDLIFDGFAEFSFASPEGLAQFMKSGEWKALQSGMKPMIDTELSLLATVDISLQKIGTPPVGAVRSTEFVNRRVDMPLNDFRQYWIGTHGPLAQNIPQIIRYEQHHLTDVEYTAATPKFDGWAVTWFSDTAAMRAAAHEPIYRETREDEHNFLAGPLPVLFTRERLAVLGA